MVIALRVKLIIVKWKAGQWSSFPGEAAAQQRMAKVPKIHQVANLKVQIANLRPMISYEWMILLWLCSMGWVKKGLPDNWGHHNVKSSCWSWWKFQRAFQPCETFWYKERGSVISKQNLPLSPLAVFKMDQQIFWWQILFSDLSRTIKQMHCNFKVGRRRRRSQYQARWQGGFIISQSPPNSNCALHNWEFHPGWFSYLFALF